MSLFYTLAYWVGFRPWETAAMREAGRVSTMFDREESGRQPPYGPALDLGCGTGMQAIVLARRGWQITGVEIVQETPHAAALGTGFWFVLDFGCFHGLTDSSRPQHLPYRLLWKLSL